MDSQDQSNDRERFMKRCDSCGFLLKGFHDCRASKLIDRDERLANIYNGLKDTRDKVDNQIKALHKFRNVKSDHPDFKNFYENKLKTCLGIRAKV